MYMTKPTMRITASIACAVLVLTSVLAVGTQSVHAEAKGKTVKVANVSKVRAKSGAGRITVSWKKVKQCGYIVYMAKETKSGKPGKFKVVKKLSRQKKVKYTKKNLTVGKRYYFKVKAYVKKNGKAYTSRFSKMVSAKVKGGKIGGTDPKKPDYWYKTPLPSLKVDGNGAYHISGNGTDTKGAYALYVSNYPTLESKGGLVPVHVLTVKDKRCTAYYTTDGTTPSPSNGKKVTKRSGNVKVYLDKRLHTYKVRGYVDGKEVFHDYFTDGYLYYYDRLPSEDPGPLVGGAYQGFKYGGLVDGLIWWQ